MGAFNLGRQKACPLYEEEFQYYVENCIALSLYDTGIVPKYGGVLMAIVSDEQVIKVLQWYNPWWHNPSKIKEGSKPQRRFTFYEALKMLRHSSIRRFVVLSGVQRVWGKRRSLYQIMEGL